VWGWKGFCNRKKEGGIHEKAKLNLVSIDALAGIGMVTMLLIMMPRDFIEEVMLYVMGDGVPDLTFREFLRWIRI